MEVAEKVAAKLALLPDGPGVYQMRDKRARVIYIGKALNLKNRVSSYFQPHSAYDPRIAHMVRQVRDLDWIVVPSELDALMLESSLVRQFQPYYNTMLKDDKSYPYVKITLNEPYPRVMLTRSYLADGAKYWGPMTNVHQVRGAVRFVAGLFTVRTCKLELDGERFFEKPCLDYHLKLCSAPCTNYIAREEYGRLVHLAVDFFNGHFGHVLGELRRRMRDNAEQQEYENAARYRDLIAAVERSFERTRVIGKPGENMDVLGVARSKDRACIMLMPVRDGRLVGDRRFILNHRLEDAADNDVLTGFLMLHYANPENIPPELVLPHVPEDAELLRQWMGKLRAKASPESSVQSPESEERASTSEDQFGSRRRTLDSRRVAFTYPQRGQKAELLAIAQRNAEERLHTELAADKGDFVVTPGQRALAEHLGLAEWPRRVEGYDVAMLQGKQAAGALVVFIGGRKDSAEYRMFNIRGKDTPDDFAMLRETLSRRLLRLLVDPHWDRTVDLIMIDGGKGQLSSAKQVFDGLINDPRFDAGQRMKMEAIKLCSLAKQEELIYHYDDTGAVVELRLPPTDPGLRLLVAVRDEAHRFSNTQHTKLREKAMRISVLDTVPGLGESRSQALLRHFGSVKRLREAALEDLAAVPGIGPKLAALIKRYLERDAELEEGKSKIRREMQIKRKERQE